MSAARNCTGTDGPGLRRVVILGGTGFIGSTVGTHLLQVGGYTVSSASSSDVDLTSEDGVARYAATVPAGSVLVVGVVANRAPLNSFAALRANTAMAVNVAWLVAECAFSHVVYLSTVDVYDRVAASARLSERSAVVPTGYYGIAKYCGELLIGRAAGTAGCLWTVLRLPGVYGPGDGSGRIVSHIVAAASEGRRLTIMGDGSQRRDLLYVRDVARVVAAVLQEGVGGTFNLVSGVSVSVNDIVEAIEKVAGRVVDKSYSPADDVCEGDLTFEASGILDVLAGFRFTGIVDGLRETWQELLNCRE